MAKAIADPDELRRFAQSLKRFNEGLAGGSQKLQAQFLALGQTWRDEEHKRFAEEFEALMRQVARFSDEAEKHAPFLLRKAERIEEYLRQR